MKNYKEYLEYLNIPEEAPVNNIGSGNIAGVDNPGKMLRRKKRHEEIKQIEEGFVELATKFVTFADSFEKRAKELERERAVIVKEFETLFRVAKKANKNGNESTLERIGKEIGKQINVLTRSKAFPEGEKKQLIRNVKLFQKAVLGTAAAPA